MSLKSRSVLVTGGANGIGKVTVRALLSRGCKVNIVDMMADDLKKALQEFQDLFGQENVTSSVADVTSDREMRAAFDNSITLFGGLDIVINNAGIMLEGQWERMVQVNLVGVVRGTEMGIEYMSPGTGGIILNMGSTTGTEAALATQKYAFAPVYSATKAGVLAYSRCMAASKETREKRIQICCLCPNTTLTNMIAHVSAETSRDEQAIRTLIATGEPASPDVVAEKVVSLVESDDVNGSVAIMDTKGEMSFY